MKSKHNFASTLQLIDFRENSVVLNHYDQSDRFLFVFLLIYEWEQNFKLKNKNAVLSKNQINSLIIDIKPESEAFPFADPSSLDRCVLTHLLGLGLLTRQDKHITLPDGFPKDVSEELSWPVRSLFSKHGFKLESTTRPIRKILSDFDNQWMQKKASRQIQEYQQLPNFDDKGTEPAILFFRRHSIVLKDFNSYQSDRELFFISLMIEFQLMFPNLKLPSTKDLVGLCQAVTGLKFDRSIVQRMIGDAKKLNLTENPHNKLKFKIDQCKTATSIIWNLQPLAHNSKNKLTSNYDLATPIIRLLNSFELRWGKNLKKEELHSENTKENKDEISGDDQTKQYIQTFTFDLDNSEIVKNTKILPPIIKQEIPELEAHEIIEPRVSNTKRSMELDNEIVSRNKKSKKDDPIIKDVSENSKKMDYESVSAKLPEYSSGNREQEKMDFAGVPIKNPFAEEFISPNSTTNLIDKRKSPLSWPAYQRFGFLSGKGKPVSEEVIPFTTLKKIDVTLDLKNISVKKSARSQQYFLKVTEALELKETHKLNFEQNIKSIREKIIAPLMADNVIPFSYESIIAPIAHGQHQEIAKAIILLLKDAYAICLGLKKEEPQLAHIHEKNAIKIAMQLEIAIDYFCEVVKTSLEITQSITRLAKQSNLPVASRIKEGVDPVVEVRNCDFDFCEGALFSYGKSLALEISYRGVNAVRIHTALVAKDIYEKLTLDELETYITNLFKEYERLVSIENSQESASKREQIENFGSSLLGDADFDELTVAEHQDRIGQKWKSEIDNKSLNDKAEIIEEDDTNFMSTLISTRTR